MNEWLILGIDETRDANTVRQAYMRRIKEHNPEDDPEGFRRVREAYEQILKKIKETDNPEEEDTSPPGLFMKRVQALYDDYPARVEPDRWRELLRDEAVTRLDLEEQTEERLLGYLMDHFRFPPSVWRQLDGHFGWTGGADRLRKDYPGGFVDFIISQSARGGRNDDRVFRLFSYDGETPPDAGVYDQWLSLYFPLMSSVLWQHIYGNDPAAFAASIEDKTAELAAIPLRNTEYTLLCAQIDMMRGDPEKALAVCEPLAADMPGYFFARFTLGLVLFSLKRYTEATGCFRSALELEPDDFDATRGLVDCLMTATPLPPDGGADETEPPFFDPSGEETNEEARNLLLGILDRHPFNAYALNTFRTVTERFITLYESKRRANPADADAALILAKHYLNAYQYAECRRLLESCPPDTADPRYSEYLADCLANAGEYERACALYAVNVAAVPKYRNYVKYISVLIDAGRNEEAVQQAETALSLEDGDTLSLAYLHDNKGLALAALNQNDEALAAFEESLRINSQTAHVLIHKGKTCKRLNRYAEAVECCDQAISVYPFLTEAYTVQMEIFYESDLYDRMLELADQARQCHYESPRVQYYEACALRMKNEMDKAEALLEALLEAEEDEGYRDYFHAEMAYLALSRSDYAAALRNMEESVRLNPEPVYRRAFLANTHRLRGAYADAISLYGELLTLWPDYIGAMMGLGNVYFDMKDYENAVLYFKRALGVNEQNEQAFDRIIDSFLAENRFAEALTVAEREQVLFDNMENCLRLAWLYGKNNRPEAAEASYRLALERYPDSEQPFLRYGYYCKNVSDDQEQALTLLKRSLEIKPDQPILYSDIAYCLSRLKRYEEALAAVDDGLVKYPAQGDLYIRRGLVLSDLGRHLESLEALLAGTADENQIEPHWNLSTLYNRIGIKYELYRNDAANALLYYERALTHDENCADAHKNIGDLQRYYFLNYAEALRRYQIKIRLEPEEVDGYLARGKVRLRARLFNCFPQPGRGRLARADFMKALTLYERYLELDPDNHFLYVYIGDCYLWLNRLDRAREFFEEVIQKAPPVEGLCEEAYFGLGQLHEKLKEYEKALAYYEKAFATARCVQFSAACERTRKKVRGESPGSP